MLFVFIPSIIKYKLVQVQWRSTNILKLTATRSRSPSSIRRSSFELRQPSASLHKTPIQVDSYSSMQIRSGTSLNNIIKYSRVRSPALPYHSMTSLPLKLSSKTQSLHKRRETHKKITHRTYLKVHLEVATFISIPLKERMKTALQPSLISARIRICSQFQASQTTKIKTTRTISHPTITFKTTITTKTLQTAKAQTSSSLQVRSKDRPYSTLPLQCAAPTAAAVTLELEPTRTLN